MFFSICFNFLLGCLTFWYKSNKELGKKGVEKNGSLERKICHGDGLEEREGRT